jgi:prepilin-type N-terminal cleavage/methylation domain-containing protein
MLQKGFTLIEAMIVIIILMLIGVIGFAQLNRTPENVMIKKEKAEWIQHLDSVKDKIFIIEIDGKKHSVVVKDVQE